MESNLYEALGQVSSSDAGRDHLRGCVRQMICEVMAAEADELCGVKHQPSESEHFRAGGSPGRVVVEGERESVVRPRVRKRNSDGGSEEAILTTYQAARDPRQLQDSIVTALMHGVSTRDVGKVKPNSPSVGGTVWEQFGEGTVWGQPRVSPSTPSTQVLAKIYHVCATLQKPSKDSLSKSHQGICIQTGDELSDKGNCERPQ